MNPCDDCPIDDKIYECCGRFPETGDTALRPVRENHTLRACPYLSAAGKCKIYEKRPYACRSHHCYHYDTINGVGGSYQSVKDQWKNGWADGEI